MTDPRFYIFAGGGTGGHLYPGLAVAESLMRLDANARVVFACSGREVDRRVLDPTPHARVPQPVLPLPRSLGGVLPFLRAYVRSAFQARDMVRDLRPVAVLGLGGFAAAPVLSAAAKVGIRTGLLNPDAVPGKANRHLSRRVDAIFTQFEPTAQAFPAKVRQKVLCAGCPIRPSLLKGSRTAAMEQFGLDPDRRTLLVFGGSLAAASINQAMFALAGEMAFAARTWQVLHVAGQVQPAAEAYAKTPLRAAVLEYCDRMDLAYAAADLAVCRGGASTVAELTATATPAVILPYPHHRDRQQELNAAALVRAGAAAMVDDAGATPATVAGLRAALLPLLDDAARLRGMREAAGRLAKPRAAETVAEWLVGPAGRPG